MDLNRATWRKSSYSTPDGGDCVELANAPATVAIRDTKNRDGGTLFVGRESFRRFAGAVKSL
ncbi:DUF397 domain-containing protein [Actinomadura flavalba]|uniref:DUF397 domain-containing protein n=1 Tax=Actinomadura flavalba TaxID=1120938 RepID=UPI00036D35F1|nr:DUF397 domain-containing protein [Actinomadura flavalba]